MRAWLLAPVLLVSGLANAEPGYIDAETIRDAVYMMLGMETVVEAQYVECSTRLPQHDKAYGDMLWKWKVDANRALIAANDLTAIMTVAQTKELDEALQLGRDTAVGILDKRFADSQGEAFCSTIFADLASSAWRDRWPNMYEILEVYSASAE